jgi:hypothetical protein
MHRRRPERQIIDNRRYRRPHRQRVHAFRIEWGDDRIACLYATCRAAKPGVAGLGDDAAVCFHFIDTLLVRAQRQDATSCADGNSQSANRSDTGAQLSPNHRL